MSLANGRFILSRYCFEEKIDQDSFTPNLNTSTKKIFIQKTEVSPYLVALKPATIAYPVFVYTKA